MTQNDLKIFALNTTGKFDADHIEYYAVYEREWPFCAFFTPRIVLSIIKGASNLLEMSESYVLPKSLVEVNAIRFVGTKLIL